MNKNEQTISELFRTIIDTHEIDESTNNGFTIYTAKNDFGAIFSFGHNPQTNKYGIKREKQLAALYKLLDIPFDVKPENFKELYNLMKTEYILQVVNDTVNALPDALPGHYQNIR